MGTGGFAGDEGTSMRARNWLFAVLLILGLGLLGWPKADVPVPDYLGTSRDWTEPENAELFRPVEAEEDDGATSVKYDRVIYDELGKNAAQ